MKVPRDSVGHGVPSIIYPRLAHDTEESSKATPSRHFHNVSHLKPTFKGCFKSLPPLLTRKEACKQNRLIPELDKRVLNFIFGNFINRSIEVYNLFLLKSILRNCGVTFLDPLIMYNKNRKAKFNLRQR